MEPPSPPERTSRICVKYKYKYKLVVKGALQLLINRYGYIRFAHVHERVSTKSFVVLIIGNSESNHLGAQGIFKYKNMYNKYTYKCKLVVNPDVYVYV